MFNLSRDNLIFFQVKGFFRVFVSLWDSKNSKIQKKICKKTWNNFFEFFSNVFFFGFFCNFSAKTAVHFAYFTINVEISQVLEFYPDFLYHATQKNETSLKKVLFLILWPEHSDQVNILLAPKPFGGGMIMPESRFFT